MSELQEFSEEIFVKLSKKPPDVNEQAGMLIKAMEEYMRSNVYMTVEKVDERYVEITGDIKGPANKNVFNIVGRAGEVAIYDSVITFLSNPKMEQRYSQFVMESTATVLIPADFNLQARATNALLKYLTPLGAQMIEMARKEWEALHIEESVSDFLMKNAYPIESKASIDTYVFLHEGGGISQAKGSKPSVRASNKYIKSLVGRGGKVVVGASFFDVVLEDIGEKILAPLEENIYAISATATREKDSPIIVDLQADKTGSGKLFKMIGVRLSMFVPLVASKKTYEKFLINRVIKQGDRKAIAATVDYTLRSLQQLINHRR